MDFTSTPIVLINYFLILYSWIYFRDFVYAYEVVWKGSMFGKWNLGGSTNSQLAFICLLIGLLILNLYWTFLFFRMGYRFVSKGEVKDLQNPVEDIKKAKSIKQK